MGKASSAKKIKRVQQAGVSRAPGQRRNLAYPALIAVIVVVGLLLVFFARDRRQATASLAPTTKDHWHIAFAVDVCGVVGDNLSGVTTDRLGIHTHQDGLVHLEPNGSGASGKNATFQKFADFTGVTLGNGKFTLPDGKTYKNGDKCPKSAQVGEVGLYVWPPQANDQTKAKVTRKNLGDVRFTGDGQSMVLSFAPKGQAPKLPPSVASLKTPSEGGSTAPPASTGSAPETSAPETSAPGTSAPVQSVPATTAPATTAPANAAGSSTTVKPAG